MPVSGIIHIWHLILLQTFPQTCIYILYLRLIVESLYRRFHSFFTGYVIHNIYQNTIGIIVLSGVKLILYQIWEQLMIIKIIRTFDTGFFNSTFRNQSCKHQKKQKAHSCKKYCSQYFPYLMYYRSSSFVHVKFSPYRHIFYSYCFLWKPYCNLHYSIMLLPNRATILCGPYHSILSSKVAPIGTITLNFSPR